MEDATSREAGGILLSLTAHNDILTKKLDCI